MSKIILHFVFLIALSFLVAIKSTAQSSFVQQQDTSVAAIGIGGGLDYGGIGANLTFFPQYNVGIFAGFGYALIKPGYNIGLKIRLASQKKSPAVVPYVTGMYGYNTVIDISDATQYNKMYYGFSAGVGIDIYHRRNRKSYWSLAILVPIRSPDVTNYVNNLQNNDNVSFQFPLLPVAFSIGYKFAL